jgi:hypothetical protein
VAAAVEEVVASGAQETAAPSAAAVEEAVAAGAQEAAPAGWTGRYRQHPRCSGRDNCTVEFVSTISLRVVLVAVVDVD